MSSEHDPVLRRLNELAARARYRYEPSFTRFLESPLEIPARTAANANDVTVRFYGGYPDAERRIACFLTDTDEDFEYPLTVLTIKWNPKYGSVGHRDILGALMGLGIEREVLGDIAFSSNDGTAYLFVCDDMANYICASLDSVGRTGVKTQIATEPVQIREPEGITLRLTCASDRLDGILAAAYKLSRSEAQKLIEGGHVRRNHIPEIRTDVRLAENDLLSVRGHGRMRIIGFDDNLTRKGRRILRVFQYT